MCSIQACREAFQVPPICVFIEGGSFFAVWEGRDILNVAPVCWMLGSWSIPRASSSPSRGSSAMLQMAFGFVSCD